MKQSFMTHSPVRQPMYPGAADERYFAGKALEILTAVLSGTGALTFMVLLVAMS